MMTVARLLLAALLGWGWAAAHAYTVLERVQWYDANNSGNLPAADDAAWQASGVHIRRAYETGTLWLRMRVQKQGAEDLYLTVGRTHVDDIAVWVHLPSAGAYHSGAPDIAPSPQRVLNATDMRDGLLLAPCHTQAQEVMTVWVRLRGGRLHSLDLDIVDQNALFQQRVLHWANVAVQLTFSALLLLASITHYVLNKNKLLRLLTGLALCAALFHLQWSGALLGLTGPDPTRFVNLSVASTVLMASVALYVSVLVLATRAFRNRTLPWLRWLLAGGLLAGLLALFSGRSAFNLAAAACIGLGMCVFFFVNFVRHALRRASWCRSAFQRVLSLIFIGMLFINFISLCSMFWNGLDWAQSAYLRAANWPILSATLFLTLTWKKQRIEAARDRRRRVNAKKLQEQIRGAMAQQQFISMMAHEIKTPLTVIQLGAKVIGQDNADAQRKRQWEGRIQTAIHSVVHILDNCSQAERFDGGLMVSVPTVFEVSAALEQVLKQAQLHQHAALEDVQLLWDTGKGPLYLHTDESYFQFILANLTGNALKYAAPGSRVTLQVSRVPDARARPCLQFAVSNALGSAGAPDPDRVFSRYYRAGTSEVSGTGLGLWLSQNMAQYLGTHITMQLEAGRVVFWFSLPEVRGDGAPASGRPDQHLSPKP